MGAGGAGGGGGYKTPGGSRGLPKNTKDLLDNGWKDITHPNARKEGHFRYKDPKTGKIVEFDIAKPGEPGHKGKDHYHIPNPNSKNRHDKYLDKDGNPTGNGSDESHIYPGDGGFVLNQSNSSRDSSSSARANGKQQLSNIPITKQKLSAIPVTKQLLSAIPITRNNKGE